MYIVYILKKRESHEDVMGYESFHLFFCVCIVLLIIIVFFVVIL